MRATKIFFKTYRDLPDKFDSPSHRLLVKTGMIQQLAAGIFSYLPLGWRSIQKIRQIINEEMVRIDSQEVNMPVVQPGEIWEQSGRIRTFIPPVARFKDRRERLMVLAPTHEESVSIMARAVIKSYRDLPQRLYHIQTKFRDEVRTRGGLLRSREFEMKDAYSFDADKKGMDDSFEAMGLAYERIFERCKTRTIRVDADSGGIGGKESSEFVMLSKSGEDIVLQCENNQCNYAANREKAVFKRVKPDTEKMSEIDEFATPGIQTIDALSRFTGEPLSRMAKVVFYNLDGKLILAAIRGDYDVNDTKLKNILKGNVLRLATADEVKSANLPAGYASPVGVDGKVTVVADDSIVYSPNLIGGANKEGYHLYNVNYERDFNAKIVGDIAQAKSGFCCVLCGGKLLEQRGIEVGHIFKLGAVYSETMDITFQDKEGKQCPVLMGCYGIGLGRLLSAIIEANHDDNGVVFPVSVAPFVIYLVGLNLDNPEVMEVANKLYHDLKNSDHEILFDDRATTAGVKFADADLLGIPVRILISARGLKNQTVEIKKRSTGEIWNVSLDEAVRVTDDLIAGM